MSLQWVQMSKTTCTFSEHIRMLPLNLKKVLSRRRAHFKKVRCSSTETHDIWNILKWFSTHALLSSTHTKHKEIVNVSFSLILI